jgi:NADH:ubiquinone oxidoreductase subunit 6 (subunit J)
MEAVVFYVCAVAMIIGALGVVLARNPVHSALFLLMTLVSVAVLFLQLDAALVAAIQVVVYASAIVVLFVFVITLLGVDKHESFDEPSLFQRPVAIVLGVLMFVQIVVLAGTTGSPARTRARRLAGARSGQRRDPGPEPLHRLRVGVRDHGGAARDRGGRRRRARAAQRAASRPAGRALRAGDRLVIAVAEHHPTYYLVLAAALFTIGGSGCSCAATPS